MDVGSSEFSDVVANGFNVSSEDVLDAGDDLELSVSIEKVNKEFKEINYLASVLALYEPSYLLHSVWVTSKLVLAFFNSLLRSLRFLL